MKIAVEGCCHGHLDDIYGEISKLEQKHNYTVDALLICGDFQAVRNSQDLQCMAVPEKYRKLGDFHKYYTGESVAPKLTLIIGGNHEASSYMAELFHGGWVAPNIYYLGNSGVVQLNGLRIAASSGLFKGHDFRQGYHERLPYNKSTMRSVYHVREFDIRRLSLLTSPNIMLSHEWPQHIAHHGDLPGLLRQKPFFETDIKSGRLGSPPLMGLMQTLQPEWWFAAHMHVRFQASVRHGPPQEEDPFESSNAAPKKVENPDEIAIEDSDSDDGAPLTAFRPQSQAPANPDEIMLSDEEDEVEAVPRAPSAPSVPTKVKETKFLALDKVLPKRQFLEVIDIDCPPSSPSSLSSGQPTLTFDPEWLAITRAFHPWYSNSLTQRQFPPEDEARAMVAEELEWVNKNVKKSEDGGLLRVDEVQKFEMTAPGPCDVTEKPPGKFRQPPPYPNPQTKAFCKMLGIEDKVNAPTS